MKSERCFLIVCLCVFVVMFQSARGQDKENKSCCPEENEKACCSEKTQEPCKKHAEVCLSQFDPNQWYLEDDFGYNVVDFKGKKALHIKKKNWESEKDGTMAIFKGLEFDNGTIEFDMSSKIMSGVVFRAQDNKKAECIYFRPCNSGTEEHHNHTVQYVAKGSKYTWNYLRENFPGKYEAGAELKEFEWFHVRLEICCSFVKVFVNDATEPCLVVNDMKYGQSKGQIGLWGWEGYFANLKVTPKMQ